MGCGSRLMLAKCMAGNSSRVGEKAETRVIPRFLA